MEAVLILAAVALWLVALPIWVATKSYRGDRSRLILTSLIIFFVPGGTLTLPVFLLTVYYLRRTREFETVKTLAVPAEWGKDTAKA